MMERSIRLPAFTSRHATPIALLIAAAAAIYLYLFPPTSAAPYPQCLFHTLTGLHCPGCGTARSLHALVHLDFAQALAWNPLAVLVLPFVGLYGLNRLWLHVRGRRLIHWRPRGWMVWTLLVLVILFWIARNLPFSPFTLLAPHALG